MVFSVILLVIGIALLLMNIGVISLEIKELFVMFLPIVFIVYGFINIFDSIRKRSSGPIFLSLFFLLYGSLLMLNKYQMINFSYGDWWKLWPVLIIYLAVKKIFFKKGVKVTFQTDFGKDTHETLPVGNVESRKHKKSYSLLGDMDFKKQNWPLKSMDLHNAIGDYYFDFSKAFIPEEETTIKIKSRIGDVKMLIPEDIPVLIETKTKVGDIRLFDMDSTDTKPHLLYESPIYHEAVKKIKITIEIGIGSIRIDRV